MKSPEQVQKEREALWLDLPNVIGVGLGEVEGRPGLLVFISAPDASHAKIAAEAEGHAVRIVVTGTVKALE